MRTIRGLAELRAELAPARREGRSIGLVPTMGAFHEGHLSLMRRARADCDVVVVSLFVNPTQFNEAGDLDAYPRDEERDGALAAEAGVDVLFVPGAEEVYSPGFATTVAVGGVADRLEGVERGRGHFEGVATVVAKLLNMVDPDIAFFGQKDAQQVAVIRQMVRDLDFGVRIEVCPTVRAADGLALSSRNVRLSTEDRRRALSLSRALWAIQAAVAAGERDPEVAVATGRAQLQAAGVSADYLAVVDPLTMAPAELITGDALAVVAARVGPVRLIDNAPLAARPTTPHNHHTAVATPERAPTG